MYKVEKFGFIPPNDHGYMSFNLLGKPLAKITIPGVYKGL